ncbi:hypothetical protein ACMBCN_03045 [Candidatus Liberibacter asiaticus]
MGKEGGRIRLIISIYKNKNLNSGDRAGPSPARTNSFFGLFELG